MGLASLLPSSSSSSSMSWQSSRTPNLYIQVASYNALLHSVSLISSGNLNNTNKIKIFQALFLTLIF